MKVWQGDGIFDRHGSVFVAQERLGRDEQEDCIGAHHLDSETVLVLCDGMGGHDAGAKASSVAVRAFIAGVKSAIKTLTIDCGGQTITLADRLLFATHYANAAVQDVKCYGKTPGTTLVGAIVTTNEIGIVHVGDSRAYVLVGGACVQATFDHNLAEAHRRNGHGRGIQTNVLTQYIGSMRDEIRPDVVIYDRPQAWGVLLASDGLHGVVEKRLKYDDDAVARLLWPAERPASPAAWLSYLRGEVVNYPPEGKKLDNLSMAVWSAP